MFDIILSGQANSIEVLGSIVGNGNDSASLSQSLTSLGLREGDIVLVIAGHSGTSEGDMAFSIGGYTQVCDLFSDDSRQSNLHIGYKEMGVSPDTSVTITTLAAIRGCAYIIYGLRGVDDASVMDTAPTTGTVVDSANITPPAITAATFGNIIFSAAFGALSTTPQDYATSTGFDDFLSETVASGTNGCVAAGYSRIGQTTFTPLAFTNAGTTTFASACACSFIVRAL